MLCSSHFENITANHLSLYQIFTILFSLVVRVCPPSWSLNYLKCCLVFFFNLELLKICYCFHHLWLFHSIFNFCQISDGNVVHGYKPCSLPKDIDFSYLVYWGPCRRWCIWGVSDLDQAMSALLGLVLGAWEARMLAVAATTWEPAGVPCTSLCCMLVGIMTEITFQPVRRRYMILFATQNKSTTAQEGDSNLSTDRICATCCGKMHLGSVQCCTKTGFPGAEGI